MKSTLAPLPGLFALALALAPAATAQDGPAPEAPAAPAAAGLELTATLAAPKVAVGELARVVVRLRNAGAAAAEALELAEDRAVVSFDVKQDDGRVFEWSKLHPGPENPRADWPRKQLEPGAQLELEVPFPALAAGKFTITARYRRNAEGAALAAAPVVLEVTPAGNGGTEVEVVMTTSHGPLRLRLFPKEALGTCLHFARLVLAGGEVDGRRGPGFYDGTRFHRVIPGFMIQGGDPAGNGTGGPGYGIPAEFATRPFPETLKHVPGRLSMARSQHEDSAGSQFFICVGAPSSLDGNYTCFGEVTRGLDVAYSIADVPCRSTEGMDERSTPLEPVKVHTVRLVPRKPVAAQAPAPGGGGQ